MDFQTISHNRVGGNHKKIVGAGQTRTSGSLSLSGTMLLAHEEHSFNGSGCVAHDTLDLT